MDELTNVNANANTDKSKLSLPIKPISNAPMENDEKERQVQLAEQLYQDALKMQKSAKELMASFGKKTENEDIEKSLPVPNALATKPMPQQTAQAVNNALIGKMPR